MENSDSNINELQEKLNDLKIKFNKQGEELLKKNEIIRKLCFKNWKLKNILAAKREFVRTRININ